MLEVIRKLRRVNSLNRHRDCTWETREASGRPGLVTEAWPTKLEVNRPEFWTNTFTTSVLQIEFALQDGASGNSRRHKLEKLTSRASLNDSERNSNQEFDLIAMRGNGAIRFIIATPMGIAEFGAKVEVA
jgi:hypothetical protein